jgi:hypothetical protein
MTAQLMETRLRPTFRGGVPLLLSASADRRLLDVIRLVITIVLVVLGVVGAAGTGALVGAGVMPVEGPTPGMGL